MKKVRIILASAVLLVMAVGFAQLTTVQAAEAPTLPVCKYYCAGHWCSGWGGPCWQYCNGEGVVLDCDQICGKHC